MMEANAVVALLKFFRDEKYLDQLINGRLYCNTPEYYRNNGEQGVGDKYESCVMSYREARGDSRHTLLVNGRELTGLINFTLRGPGDFDSWMHCWTTLRMPEDEEALARLRADMNRIQREFGPHYALMPGSNFDGFVNRVADISEHRLRFDEVTYSADEPQWSSTCKSPGYAYQREFRFLFGKCSPQSDEPYVLEVPGGLGQFLVKNPEIQFVMDNTGAVPFKLSAP